MFKFAILIASLACASAGYAGVGNSGSYAAPVAAHYSSAPAVSYSTFNRHQSPSLAYASPAHGYAQAVPVLAASSNVYAAPLAHSYAASSLSYGQSYVPSLSHQNYGYSKYAASLDTKTLAVAQPQFYHPNTYAAHAVIAPVLAAPNHAYGAPLAHTYAAPALSYGQSYAPSLSHQNYGYSAYAAPLTTKTLTVAQPQLYQHNTYASHVVGAPVLATRGFNYAPAAAGAHLLGYNNHHGHYAY